jgi:hypothetical protein
MDENEKLERNLAEARHQDILEEFQKLRGALPKNDEAVRELISTFTKKLDEFSVQEPPEVNVQVEKVSNTEVVEEIKLLKDVMERVLKKMNEKEMWKFTPTKNGFQVITEITAKQL